MEFFLVQVGYKLLIWGGQQWGMACEKAIKVLRVTPTLPWRKREMERERGGGEDGVNLMGDVKKKRTTHDKEKKGKYN